MSDPHLHHGDTSDAESEQDLAKRVHERQHRPASIDMALNLERELDDEHEHENEHGVGLGSDGKQFHSSTSIEASSPGQEHVGDGSRRVSLDPQVLQRIVTNLRTELSQAQSERDALAETLAGAPTRETELREALNLLTERCAADEAELERLKRKSQEDDESIQMLRTKLEESRRALMRLQTESKRMSQMSHMSHMSVDISRANTLFGSVGGPSSSKRASFTPLTGSGASGGGTSRMNYSHRRISSVSEPSDVLEMGAEPASPTTPGHAVSWPSENDANAKKSRRSSAFFGGMPMSMGLARSTTPSPPQQQRQLAVDGESSAQELEALRKERDAARAELASARQELAEAQEAREASEQCVAALRTFISGQADSLSSGDANGAIGILKLPPLPTEKNVDDSGAGPQNNTPNKRARPVMGAGWSFGKLFRTESGGSGSSATDSTGASPPADGKHASANSNDAIDMPTPTKSTSGVSSGSHSPSPSTAIPGGAFSRTFGGFFSARAPSITSIGSVAPPNTNTNSTVPKDKPRLPPRPPTAHGQQEPTLNGLGSDEEDADADESLGSSAVTSPPEPVSPDPSRASEEREMIWFRNASSSAGSEVGDRVSLGSASAGVSKEKNKGIEAPLQDPPVQVGAAS